MSALTLTLKQRTDQRVDMSPLSCHLLAGKDPAEIAAIELQNGKRKVRVGELFTISGDDTHNLVIRNSFGKLDYIGKDLQGGKISVEGSAGAYLALGMKSGHVGVSGDVGIFAACEMKSGMVIIDGNAGDFLGGALPGNKQGMRGGLVLVKGNAGERVGDHLRRGTILIEGDAGDYCGSRMLAGTIAVLGKTGRHLGYAMNRGTVLLWNAPEIPATFNDCGTHTLAFLPMLFASFKNLDSKFAHSGIAFNRARRYGGDVAAVGRGEILVKW
jgi:formylmethanofuran dehydrogenase subunit C